MSGDDSPSKIPNPPSFEAILSDLQKSSLQDVAFQHPSEVCPDVKRLIGHSSLSPAEKDPTKKDVNSSYLPTQSTGITTGDDINQGQDKEKYIHVTDFIKNYKALVKSSSELKDLGENLNLQRLELEEKIELVHKAWTPT